MLVRRVHERQLRVLGNRAQALLSIRRVEQHRRSAGPQGAEQSDGQLGSCANCESHARRRVCVVFAEHRGDAPAPRVDIRTGIGLLFLGERRRAGTVGNPLREQISFAVVGKTVSVSFGADRKISGPLEGAAVSWTDEAGSPLKVTFSLVKGRIVMHCQGEGGARRNVFTLDEPGDKLTMSVTMSSDRLPVPVKYALTYRRK